MTQANNKIPANVPYDVFTGDKSRLKQFGITPELFLSLGNGKFEVIANQLPDDVEFLGGGFDYQRWVFVALITSESFPEVADRSQIPFCEATHITRLK